VRRRFGIQAFGVNAYTAAQAGDRIVEEHTEATNGHEELYFVAAGTAVFALDGEEVEAPAGTFVFVRPPTNRGAVARAPGTTVVAMGGRPGQAFTPSTWEPIFLAYAYRRLGDVEQAWAVLRETVAQDPTAWQGHYHMACFSALDGDREEAIGHLLHAVELDPAAARRAAGDEDLAAIRDDPRFPRTPTTEGSEQ
jgi:tetratricopeptide (TPR) repeat protein